MSKSNSGLAIFFDQVLADLPADARAEIEAQAERRQAAYRALNLADLRKSRGLSQVNVAKTMGGAQEVVSRLERAQDMKLSTLRRHVEALGGRLILAAEFNQGEDVIEIAGLEPDGEAALRPSEDPAKESA